MKKYRNYLLIGLIPLLVWGGLSLYLSRGSRPMIDQLVSEKKFNLYTWELSAIVSKIEANLLDAPSYLPEDQQKQWVYDYLDLVQQSTQLNREQEGAIAQQQSAEIIDQLSQQLADIQTEIDHLQPIAEDILERQLTEILLDESFGVGGGIYPPVLAKITPLPNMLIISPRDQIAQKYVFPLKAGMTSAEKTALEQTILKNADLAAIVVPIGGLGVYPTMIIETTRLPYLTDVIAHEWSHNWMLFRPIGYKYLQPNMRTINETTASLFGQGIQERMVDAYYPELIEPVVEEVAVVEETPVEPEEIDPTAFDFRTEMRITREQLDIYLADRLIEEAEQYLQERQQLFVENRYNIRTLNQAYFAFYGAYADSPSGGASGADPIGPAIQEIYQNSSSIRAFMDTMSGVGSQEELQNREAK